MHDNRNSSDKLFFGGDKIRDSTWQITIYIYMIYKEENGNESPRESVRQM